MKATSIFLTTVFILFVVNALHLLSQPQGVFDITLTSITSFIITGLAIITVSGVTILGTGLSDSSVKAVIGFGIMFNILFQIEVLTFKIGFGLLSNIYNIFAVGDFWGLGFLITTVLGVLCVTSGGIMILGGGD